MLKGSIVPLITPFRQGQLDAQALEGLIERQIRSGSHGISVGGTTGEPGSLRLDERKELIALAVRLTRGRLPVLAGTGSLRLDEAIELTHYAREVGASAALVITPYYVKPNQQGLYAFFAEIARNVPNFPLILYNIPGRTGVELEVETVRRLHQEFPQIQGLKHSSPDLGYVSRLIQALGEGFSVFCGLEEFTLPMMSLGAVGTIAATANWLPQEVAKLCELALQGALTEARKLHYFLFEANQAIFWDTNPIPLKTVLAWMGLCAPEWRPPLGPTRPEVEVRLRAMAERYGLLAPQPR